jgi:hypothetical protein
MSGIDPGLAGSIKYVSVDKQLKVTGGKSSFKDTDTLDDMLAIMGVEPITTFLVYKYHYNATTLIEELYRPDWYDNSYSVQNIGKEIYTPLLGCDSIYAITNKDLKKTAKLTVDGVTEDVYSTADIMNDVLSTYNKLGSPELKDTLSGNYNFRPLVSLPEVFGPGGLYSSFREQAFVNDPSLKCTPKSQDTGSGNTKESEYDPSLVYNEKRKAVIAYVLSVSKESFR